MSHAELDEAEELDDGDPQELGQQYEQLRASLPHHRAGRMLRNRHRHIDAIRQALRRPRAALRLGRVSRILRLGFGRHHRCMIATI